MEQKTSESSTGSTLSPAAGAFVIGIQSAAAWLSRHWLLLINGFFGVLLFGAFLAPTLMAAGWEGPSRVLYAIYNFACHQLPERALFLYGSNGLVTTYSTEQVVAAGADPTNVLTLRNFIGTPELGWKFCLCARCMSMYAGAVLAGVTYHHFSRLGRVRSIPIWLLLLMTIPMAVDGVSHMLSELTQLGFRETNVWAMPLFGLQSPEFYSGTTFGTLNWTLRVMTGLLFGLGMMLFAYPLIGFGFNDLADEAERTLERNRSKLAEP